MEREDNKHYSEKGGHQARGFFWKAVKRFPWLGESRMLVNMPVDNMGLVAENRWLIKRNMFRDPKSGRR